MLLIQIVEDDYPTAIILKKLLEAHGHKIIGLAFNGKIALDQFKSLEIKPDIILMDYRMPIKNGLETSIEMLKIDAHINIIFISADDTIKDKIMAIGAFDLIKKPFDFDEILGVIKKIRTHEH
ncbi:MAG: response regulator [Candidatus Lokiarchaeota archaeon]|nr:response regulator [Candidatus Lokiarchaeota archaeon]